MSSLKESAIWIFFSRSSASENAWSRVLGWNLPSANLLANLFLIFGLSDFDEVLYYMLVCLLSCPDT